MFLLLLFFNTVSLMNFGQSSKVIRTQEENMLWFQSTKHISLNKQIEAIKERLLSDTAVYFTNSSSDRLFITETPKNKIKTEVRPIIIVNNYLININNATKANQIENFNSLLKESSISSIQIFIPNEIAAQALYGSDAANGIIIISMPNKKAFNKIKKINF